MMYARLLARSSRCATGGAACSLSTRTLVLNRLPMAAAAVVPTHPSFYVTAAASDSSLLLSSSTSARRSFSTDAATEATDALADLLQREYDEEMENETTTVPEALETLQKSVEKDWKIVNDGSMTKLYKTLEGTGVKVQVSFHCQDSVESMSNFDEEEISELEQEENEESTAFRFTVTATKAGQTVVMNCVSEYAEARIEGVYVSRQEVDQILINDTAPSDYQGPDFEELAADLKEAYLVYLQETIGITEDVASFIAMYADYKEQCGYVGFLDDCKKILT